MRGLDSAPNRLIDLMGSTFTIKSTKIRKLEKRWPLLHLRRSISGTVSQTQQCMYISYIESYYLHYVQEWLDWFNWGVCVIHCTRRASVQIATTFLRPTSAGNLHFLNGKLVIICQFLSVSY